MDFEPLSEAVSSSKYVAVFEAKLGVESYPDLNRCPPETILYFFTVLNAP